MKHVSLLRQTHYSSNSSILRRLITWCTGIIFAAVVLVFNPAVSFAKEEYQMVSSWEIPYEYGDPRPERIAMDNSGYLYIGSTIRGETSGNYSSTINKYTFDGSLVTSWNKYEYDSDQDGKTESYILKLVALSVNGSGNVYTLSNVGISGTTGGEFVKFTPDGECIAISSWGELDNDRPWLEDMAVGSDDSVYGIGSGGIYKFNSAGKYQTTIKEFEEEYGSHYPSSIAVDTQGNIYTFNSYDYTLQKLDSYGNLITQWTVSYLYLASPYLRVDAKGNVYTVHTGGSREWGIFKFTSDGELITKIATNYGGDDDFVDAAVSSEGEIYVINYYKGQYTVQKYALKEGTSEPSPTPTPSSTPMSEPTPTPLYKVIENKRPGEELVIGDPINAGSGAYSFTLPMIHLGGPMELGFTLSYCSDNENWQERTPNDFPGSPSRFWWSPRSKLYIGNAERLVWTEDGAMVSFNADGSLNEKSTKSNPDNGQPIPYVMKDTTDYVYVMNPVTENVYIFQKGGTDTAKGRILYAMDRNGNHLKYNYESAEDNNPSKIEDNTGRQLTFSYGDHDSTTKEAWFLDSVTDQAGRKISFNYEDKASDNENGWTLRSTTDLMGATTTFMYSAVSTNKKTTTDTIAEVLYPEGNTPYTNIYKAVKMGKTATVRVATQTDAYGNTTEIAYKQGKKDSVKTTTKYPDGGKDVLQHYSDNSPPKSLTDAEGKTASFEKSAHEQITSVTDRMGDTTTIEYHKESGKIASITNAKGGTTSYTYTAQEQTFTNPDNSETVAFTFYNLSRINYPDGTNERYEYDSKGNTTVRTDRDGKSWQSEYNGMGQVTKTTNPTGGTVDFTYNTDGTLASGKDSDTGTTTYEYDTYKRPSKVTHPDGSTVGMAYNLADRVTSVTDENGNTYTYTYDKNGNRTKATDPEGNETGYTYDLMDRVTKVTDRLGKESALSYNSMGQLSSITDPEGMKTSYGYDPRRWQNEVSIGGKAWQATYNSEGIISTRKTPLGHTTSFQSDKLGYGTSISNPLNYTTTFKRDSLSRVTESIDPLNRATTFTYDSRGLLSGVTLPDAGTTTYSRNDIGLLSRITDPNSQNWYFTYTPAGRAETQKDPTDNTWRFAYDTRGRMSMITYPDGGTQTITYDSAGNTTRIRYNDGMDLQYTYNALNRLTDANNIQFTYDVEGQITGTTDSGIKFSAVYNDAGRLETASYNNDAFAVTYSYSSETGLLTRVTDGLTGTQIDFTYDDDMRLTNIKRSNGINATFTWDKASRLTRIQDGDFLDLQYVLDAASQVRSATIKAPLDPAANLSEETHMFTYDAACQVSTDGYIYDRRGRLTALPGNAFTWDGASHVTEIGDVSLAYNGMGGLRTRVDGESTTQYYYNHAIDMNLIMAEKDGDTGKFLRYYVWTPGGQLLYMIDAANSNKVYFYHFDRTGSTLSLTDAEGTVTDAYAYTPHGMLLQHDGSSAQPFTFLGKWGIRQEGTGGEFYQIRARYYNAGIRRFISRDQAWPTLIEPRTLNPYQYAFNNPVTFIDISGFGGNTADAMLDLPWHGNTPVYVMDGDALFFLLDTGNEVSEPVELPNKPEKDSDKWERSRWGSRDLFAEAARALLGPDAPKATVNQFADHHIRAVNVEAFLKAEMVNAIATGMSGEHYSKLAKLMKQVRKLLGKRDLNVKMADFVNLRNRIIKMAGEKITSSIPSTGIDTNLPTKEYNKLSDMRRDMQSVAHRLNTITGEISMGATVLDDAYLTLLSYKEYVVNYDEIIKSSR
ncbi:MAG TPA: RHS repeat-associated core domain-containing protein [Candidatus Wunengus sp. YC60]|uniref:RHS repeat-associated core domain-containing protein n=1 Tax=Candidatus Wunengus sp. YC60 TaxID=3367697 RepID=UPI004027D12C